MPIMGHYIMLNRANVVNIPTEEGVYEIYEGEETTFYGYSEDDPKGIRGRLEKHLTGELQPCPGRLTMFRFETSSRPKAKIAEYLEEFEHEHGCLPRHNVPTPQALAS